MEEPTDPTETTVQETAPPRSGRPRAPMVIGAIVVSLLLTAGAWVRHRLSEPSEEALRVQHGVAERQAEVADVRARAEALQWRAGKLRAWAEEQTAEPVRSWARERARLYAAFVAQLERRVDDRVFQAQAVRIETLCREGEVAAAEAALARLPKVAFPPVAEVLALQEETYFAPLRGLSRRTPQTYAAFLAQEPEAGQADLAALRRELSELNADAITPQMMLQVDLLAAVAPADDPVLADWSALTAASDFFENADAKVLADWRRAQQAVRAGEWGHAVARMQSILHTKVRTRPPFRRAYGWAVIKDRPDETMVAYPFLLEAAAAGDTPARVWIAEQEAKAERPAQALRWYEAAVLDGAPEAVAPALALYRRPEKEVPRDATRAVGVLRRVLEGAEASPEAELLLAKYYENGQGVAQSGGQALALYRKAAERPHVPAWAEVARCHLRGIGTERDPVQALDWATRAYAAGEREAALPILQELMEEEPDRTAVGLQQILEQESIAVNGGYDELRREIPGSAKLKLQVARRLDQNGLYGAAARLYAKTGRNDPEIARRQEELNESHHCEVCAGSGRIQTSIPCTLCAGKGTVPCMHCDGRGNVLEPGAPPCPTCGGAGQLVQEGRPRACAACGGSGKGKGSVTKKPCPVCDHGKAPCPSCTGGWIKVMKTCPECRGAGSWTMATRG